MSFRDNLQHLRKSQNITQEQLAMMLGVSRQSVTKWESEKSYPEMDKLLRICEIFDCSVDDLIKGDLTQTAPDPRRSIPEEAPVMDVCGYDANLQSYAWRLPTGVAFIIVGFAFSSLLSGMWKMPIGDPDSLSLFAFLAGVVAGLAFLIPAQLSRSDFMKEHPFIQDFYSAEDKAKARTRFTRLLVVGIASLCVGLVASVMLDSPSTGSIGDGAFLLCVAVGVWLIINGALIRTGMNIESYNRKNAEKMGWSPDDVAVEGNPSQETLAHAKVRDKKVTGITSVIMIVATIIGLLLLFVPILSTPDPSHFTPVGTPAMWFWLSWVIGGLLCAIVEAVAQVKS